MERLNTQLAAASKALDSLSAVPSLSLPATEMRDVAIMRFIYTFEAVWKAARLLLLEVEGIEANSPKATVRESFRVGLLSEKEAEGALVMADDRNLTVHVYNEQLADQINGRVPGHTACLRSWVSAMGKRLKEFKATK